MRHKRLLLWPPSRALTPTPQTLTPKPLGARSCALVRAEIVRDRPDLFSAAATVQSLSKAAFKYRTFTYADGKESAPGE